MRLWHTQRSVALKELYVIELPATDSGKCTKSAEATESIYCCCTCFAFRLWCADCMHAAHEFRVFLIHPESSQIFLQLYVRNKIDPRWNGLGDNAKSSKATLNGSFESQATYD